jgi:hypothetical protein
MFARCLGPQTERQKNIESWLPDNEWKQQPTKNMQARPRGYRGRGLTRGKRRGGFDPIVLAAIEVKKTKYDKINQ